LEGSAGCDICVRRYKGIRREAREDKEDWLGFPLRSHTSEQPAALRPLAWPVTFVRYASKTFPSSGVWQQADDVVVPLYTFCRTSHQLNPISRSRHGGGGSGARYTSASRTLLLTLSLLLLSPPLRRHRRLCQITLQARRVRLPRT